VSEEPIISEELEALRHAEFAPECYEIEKGMVRKFAEAIEDPNPRWQEVVPPTFLAALVPKALMHQVFTAKSSLTRVLNGGSELEYYQPVKIGDVISVTGRLTGLRQREGRDGAVLFMVVEMTYENQRGELVARVRNNFIRH